MISFPVPWSACFLHLKYYLLYFCTVCPLVVFSGFVEALSFWFRYIRLNIPLVSFALYFFFIIIIHIIALAEIVIVNIYNIKIKLCLTPHWRYLYNTPFVMCPFSLSSVHLSVLLKVSIIRSILVYACLTL